MARNGVRLAGLNHKMGYRGTVRDYPVERLYRDNRLNPIHEGTNGIQALDLLGRKVLMQDGAALRLLLTRMTETAKQAGADPELSEYAQALDKAIATAAATTQTLALVALQNKVDLFLANAHLYLEMLGHTVIAWIWLQQAQAARAGLKITDATDRNFYEGKLRACRYFFRYELPKAQRQAELLVTLDDTCLNMPQSAF